MELYRRTGPSLLPVAPVPLGELGKETLPSLETDDLFRKRSVGVCIDSPTETTVPLQV